MRKILVLLFLSVPAAAQTIAPSQIKPGSNGQSIQTVGGKAAWANTAAGVTSFGPSGSPRTGVIIPATGDYSCSQITSAICSLPSLFNQTIDVDGTALTQRAKLNFINGSAGTVVCVDNPVTLATDCTVTGGSTTGVTWTISDVSGSRTVGSSFPTRNTSAWPMFVGGSLATTGSGTGSITVAQGPTTFAMTLVDWKNQSTATVSSGSAGFSAVINPGYYYVVTVSGAVTTSIQSWTEMVGTGGGGGGGGGGFTAAGDLSGTSSSQTVVGLDGVEFCSGYTPTNGQFIELTTGSSPNPCYTAATPSGAGTVTSVAETVPSTLLSIGGSPITGAGTFAIGLANAAQNSVWAGPPSGGAGTPSYQTAPTFSAANLTSIPACATCVLKTSSVTTGVVPIWQNFAGNNFQADSHFIFQVDANTDSIYTTDGRDVLIPPCVFMGSFTLDCFGGTDLQLTAGSSGGGAAVYARDLFCETSAFVLDAGFGAANDVSNEHSVYLHDNSSCAGSGAGNAEADAGIIETEFDNQHLNISGKAVRIRGGSQGSTLPGLTVGDSGINIVSLSFLGSTSFGLLKSAPTSGDISNATGLDVTATLSCADTSASGTAQSCTTSPSFTPAAKSCVIYTTTTANSGTGLTLNVNGLGAKSVAKWLGTTTLAAGDVAANSPQLACYNGTAWNLSTIGNAPSGGGNVTAGGTLIGNSVVLGGNTTAVKVLPGFFTDGAGTLTLGVTGTTAGGLQLVNNTSGGITLITPTSGALGSSLATLPINTGTIAETNLAQTWTVIQALNTSGNAGTATASDHAPTQCGSNQFATGVTTAWAANCSSTKPRSIAFQFGSPGGSALTAGVMGYVTVPFACTITGWSIQVDVGTATIKFLKVAAGTAIPTIGSNSINTSGVAISTGTVIQSATLTDFTTTTVTANDIVAADLITTSGVGYIAGQLTCQ